MAAIDLEDLVPDLKVAISTPGGSSYEAVSTDEWVLRLRNAFWDGHMLGLFQGWEESEGLIFDPNNTNNTMGRGLQQAIILNAAIEAVVNEIRTTGRLRVKAGPVEYETDAAATVLREVLQGLRAKMDDVLKNLAYGGQFRGIRYIDSYKARTDAIINHGLDWVGSI